MTTDTFKVSIFGLAKYLLDDLRADRCPHYTVQLGEAQNYRDDKEWMFVAEMMIDIPRPDYENACDQAVAAYRAEKQRIQAEAGMRITKIDGEINKLLAIANEVAA